MKQPIVEFGYRAAIVDMTGMTGYLTITLHDRTNTRIHDTLKLNLARGTVRDG